MHTTSLLKHYYNELLKKKSARTGVRNKKENYLHHRRSDKTHGEIKRLIQPLNSDSDRMKDLIHSDVSRCANEECTVKEKCKRYLQREIDTQRNDEHFWISLGIYDGGEDCPYLLEVNHKTLKLR